MDLDCSFNKSETGISHLDLSKNVFLKYVKCRTNQFSVTDLNAMFETLHNNANTNEYFIDISDNPGSRWCDTEIALLKGWKVIIE
jgi:hypothetical protein